MSWLRGICATKARTIAQETRETPPDDEADAQQLAVEANRWDDLAASLDAGTAGVGDFVDVWVHG